MDLYERIEQIASQLRPVFRRTATFEWFILLLWGVLLSTQPPAVTSYLNAIGLGEGYYQQALHWFESSAFSVKQLCRTWGRWLSGHEHLKRLRGQRVYVGDGIKVAKEGRKMPGVKGLHQESADVKKPEWIRGHYFSGLCVLLERGNALLATPIVFKLHDGIAKRAKEPSLVKKMARLCCCYVEAGSYLLLDAYYACETLLKPCRQEGIHVITRVRISTVAHAPFSRLPGVRRRGRPRLWGAAVKLQELFAGQANWPQASVKLYGQLVNVSYQCWCLYWDTPEVPVLFVLTQLPNGKQLILLSTDTTLSAAEVIEAYGWRFKIEVCFRTLIHLLGGFAYRFWLKALDYSPKWPQNLSLVDQPEEFVAQVSRKVESFERFVNLHAIALGLLQIVALELPDSVWRHFPRWFRTLPAHGYPTEQIVRLALGSQQLTIFSQSRPSLLLTKFLAAKLKPPETPQAPPLAA